MFTSGRYIVIDDNIDELRSLVDALHQLGAPAIGIHYDPVQGVPDGSLVGARVLFVDLHLIDGVQIGDQTKAFDVIIQLLDSGIGIENGPYIVVLWTSHAEQHGQFENHLNGRLAPEKRPLSILHLDKTHYLKAGKTADGPKLKTDITNAVSNDPRLRAMLDWEHDVLAAASATLSALCGLIPEADRTPRGYGDHLDRLLSVLACAAVGKSHALADTRAAVGEALLPILNDRLRNTRTNAGEAAIWQNAATKIDQVAALPVPDAAKLNTMLHLALPPAEPSSPADWGALVRIPDAELQDDPMLSRFGITMPDLCERSRTVQHAADRSRCIPVLVRIGAACDYAQNKAGPIPYLFGTLVPVDAAMIDQKSRSPALMGTPAFDLPNVGHVKLWVDARFQISLTKAIVADWTTVCRVREQLLMQIASHAAEYVTRPGIISVREEPVKAKDQMQPSQLPKGAEAPK